MHIILIGKFILIKKKYIDVFRRTWNNIIRRRLIKITFIQFFSDQMRDRQAQRHQRNNTHVSIFILFFRPANFRRRPTPILHTDQTPHIFPWIMNVRGSRVCVWHSRRFAQVAKEVCQMANQWQTNSEDENTADNDTDGSNRSGTF